MKALTFGDIKKGDYIQCGENPVIYHIEHIEWFDEGVLRNFKMTDVNGNSKKYSFLTRSTEFNNGSLVGGFTNSKICECCGK